MVQSTKALYEKMCNTSDLCGKFEMIDNTIFWNLFEGLDIEIYIEPSDTYFAIDKKPFWLIPRPLVHWHPDEEDVYEQICNMGLKGNVLVIGKSLFGSGVLYMGKEENCPYSPKKKWLWGRRYYLKAE